MKAISLLETTLSEHADALAVSDLTFEGSAHLVSRILFSNLFAKLGEQNARIREATEDILLQMAGYTRLIGPTAVLSYATKIAIESDTKPKTAIGKLQLVHKILERHAHQLQDQQQLAQTVSFSKGGFKHQSNEVRGQSFHVILECYKTMGRDIKVHLSGLRIAQQEMLEKGFNKIDIERGPGQFTDGQAPSIQATA